MLLTYKSKNEQISLRSRVRISFDFIFLFLFSLSTKCQEFSNFDSGTGGRWRVPSNQSVEKAENVDDTGGRLGSCQSVHRDDVANDERQAFRGREARPSRNQRVRVGLRCGQTPSSTWQAKDRVLSRQRCMITNPGNDDCQRDVASGHACRVDDPLVLDELTPSLKKHETKTDAGVSVGGVRFWVNERDEDCNEMQRRKEGRKEVNFLGGKARSYLSTWIQ